MMAVLRLGFPLETAGFTLEPGGFPMENCGK